MCAFGFRITSFGPYLQEETVILVRIVWSVQVTSHSDPRSPISTEGQVLFRAEFAVKFEICQNVCNHLNVKNGLN
jgi:hypothetical protein